MQAMVLVPLPNYPVVCDSKVGSGRNREEWADASSSSFSPATARISLLICFLYELLYPVQSDHSWVDTIVCWEAERYQTARFETDTVDNLCIVKIIWKLQSQLWKVEKV